MQIVFATARRLSSFSRTSRVTAPSLIAILAATALVPTTLDGAMAQSVAEEDMSAPQSGLDLPKNVTFFGKGDPNLHKATAIINGQIITQTDVEQRFALIKVANGGEIPEAEQERLRVQVLRNLIDETLQIQEAAANDIIIDKAEIAESFARVASNFRQTPEQFTAFLRTKGSSPASIHRQIEGELAWSRLLRRKVQPFVNVSEDEVKAVIERLNASKGADEVRVGEIYLSATPENREQIAANAQNIIDQIRQGGSFAAYARQFSEASTAAVGGDLGWVRPAQLPDELAKAATEMSVGQIGGPIPVAGGFSILALMDKRKVLTADPRDAVLSLKQLSIAFPAGTTKEQATGRVTAFANALAKNQGCGAAADTGKALGADVVDNDNVRIRDLPPQLQEMLIKLQIGQATPPFGSVENGVRALVLCGRDDAPDAGAPSFDQIMSQIEDERVNKRARIYLRDLRRDAVIDYN
ncbi:peptidylprolyl isomerase [Sphingobium subterraneum]|nr:peptidylprolyl isomerase [Sphingobium subterraneum]